MELPVYPDCCEEEGRHVVTVTVKFVFSKIMRTPTGWRTRGYFLCSARPAYPPRAKKRVPEHSCVFTIYIPPVLYRLIEGFDPWDRNKKKATAYRPQCSGKKNSKKKKKIYIYIDTETRKIYTEITTPVS